MLYYSTRDTEHKYGVTSAEAIKNGIAPDGGLYMPDELPVFSPGELDRLSGLDYAGRAAAVLGKFLTDYGADELNADCGAAYSRERFGGNPAPVVVTGEGSALLELWHGPTCAFKDMALQLMPRLLCRALEKTGETRDILILVATSGDTGKAALEGCRDLDRVKITVFYPEDGVSTVQKLQMTTQEGEGVDVIAVRGNFDDCQTGVKWIFADKDAAAALERKNLILSSANSINFGRLVPQVVYYVSAYCDLTVSGTIQMGEEIDVCVPTGNFGNILAAYIAGQMGLPLRRLVCASNSNSVLTDFINTGIYDRNRPFHKTISPSMDILVSSNLERLLYLLCGAETTARHMRSLAETGRYDVGGEILSRIKKTFSAAFCSEDETRGEIKRRFSDGCLCDPHTAVGLHCADKFASDKLMLTVSTASPFKFAADVYYSITGKTAADTEAPRALSGLSGIAVPEPLKRALTLPVRFTKSIDRCDMTGAIL